MAAQLNAVNTKLQVLGEEYDQAKLRNASLSKQIVGDKSRLGEAQSSVAHDSKNLRHEAITAYIGAGSSSGLSAIMSSSANSLPLQQAYLDAASGSLKTAMTSLQDSEHKLSVRETTLSKAETKAAANETTLASSKKSAANLANQLSTTEQGLKGKLAKAVAQQEQIQAAQAAARSRAQQAASRTVTQAASQPPPPTVAAAQATTTASVSGSSQGDAAVKAAETQLGVPYVWGGATPGQGFDCSGLAMWAWGQAGVGLPHSAQAQYDSIAHVSMSDLQPGDLIFYASGGYIYHVIIYIGGGQAIQAEDTGTVIQITSVWGGAYGAGRP